MFEDCSNGIHGTTGMVKLPATTLANYCYSNMFARCTSLRALPALPATTITTGAYEYMFDGCSNLKVNTSSSSGYTTQFRIPSSGTTSANANLVALNMFRNTGGTYTGTPKMNQTYYTQAVIS